MHVEVEVGASLHNLKPFGIGLHHAVFDAVVHHFSQNAHYQPASTVQVAIFGCQIDKGLLEALDDGGIPTTIKQKPNSNPQIPPDVPWSM
jgi:hypothetical protein